MKFGLLLPTFSWPDLTPQKAASMKTIARRAEELGFDGLWVAEHFVVAPGLYGTAWLSTLTSLAYVAAVTERIKLGTSIIVAPLRNPILLAKEIATLQILSGGRFALGVGPGWDKKTFDAVGIPLKERGSRTDELIAALRQLLTEKQTSFHGKHFDFDEVTIDPTLEHFPELWVAGGSKIKTELSPDNPFIAESVLRRILGADAWMARAAGNDEMVQDDVRTIRRYLEEHGRDPDSLHYSHLNFFHLPQSSDREAALREQRPRFERVMGSHRSFEHLQACYFLGTNDDVIERIGRLRDAGIQSMILGPLDYDLEQVERFAKEIMPRFSD